MPKLDKYTEFYGGGDASVEGKGGDFHTFEDGEYKVKGIAKWFTVDQSEPPIPVFVPNFDATLVARGNLLLAAPTAEGSVEGPPWSGTRSEIVALVAAFGGDVSQLPEGMGSAFLIQAQKMANEAGEVITAKVKGGKGWARYIEGAVPPDEAFLWKFTGARGLDRKELSFQVKKETWNGKEIEKDVVMLQFEIAGKPNGEISPFNGYAIEVELRNPFDGVRTVSGKRVPNMQTAKNGGLLPSVSAFFNWLDVFYPGHWDWTWESDPEKSPYGTNELDNPIVVYVSEAVKANVYGFAKLTHSKGGRPYLQLKDFSKSGLSSEDVKTEKPKMPADPAELESLLHTCDTVAGFPVFTPTPKDAARLVTTFTAEGKKWAGMVLGPLCDALTYPREVRKMSPEQLRTLDTHVALVQGKDEEEIKDYAASLAHEEAF